MKKDNFELSSSLKYLSLFCNNLVPHFSCFSVYVWRWGVGLGGVCSNCFVYYYVLLLLSSRLRGFFVAPQTNNYTFWIQADGQASLYLSLSQDPEHKVLLLTD